MFICHSSTAYKIPKIALLRLLLLLSLELSESFTISLLVTFALGTFALGTFVLNWHGACVLSWLRASVAFSNGSICWQSDHIHAVVEPLCVCIAVFPAAISTSSRVSA